MPDLKPKILRLGTRDSKLARLQTDRVASLLLSRFPELRFEIVAITTGGDKNLSKPIAELGMRGVFVKELEEALLAGQVDLVVHSLKDLPTDLPDGLTLAAIPERVDPRDVLVSHGRLPFSQLAAGARVATSSRRRSAQLLVLRSDLEFVDIRGNIPTRLRKHDEGHCDAMVLAAAGLLRLGLSDRISEYLDPATSMPAVGQGALAVECRLEDQDTLAIAGAIDDPQLRARITAERAFLDCLGGGCSVPVGALAREEKGLIVLHGCIAALDGSRVFRSTLTGRPAEAQDLGRRLAEQMLADGARPIIDSFKQSAPQAVSPP